MFMFLNWKWKLENLKKPARHTENLERPWVSAEPRIFRAFISHSINVKAFPTAIFLVISTACHRRREDCDLQCMDVFISVCRVKLLSDCLENHWLPWPILELRTIMWNVTCEWPPERTKQREVTTHTAILNSVSSPFDLRSSFLLYYFSTTSVYTKFTRQVWISQIFVCLRLFMRDSSFFQKQDNVWIIWLMGAAPSCAICLVLPVNEKSHCVQSQQASKPQSELWSDPSGSLCHSPAKTPAIIKCSPWRLFQF